jgi:hypothetical protein
MDPNEALRQIRLLIKQMQLEDGPVSAGARPEFIQHARDLAETVEGLDEWLSKDGFLPDDWRSDDEKAIDSRPTAICGCGHELVWIRGEWQHNVAPSIWGDDHDPDEPAPTGPARDHWDAIDGVKED